MPPKKKFTAMLPSTPAPIEISDQLEALAAIRGIYRTDLMRAAVIMLLEELEPQEKQAIKDYLALAKSAQINP